MKQHNTDAKEQRRNEWAKLHDWASDVRKRRNLTVMEFLDICKLPVTVDYMIYMFPSKRNALLWTEPDSVGEKLMSGMRTAFKERDFIEQKVSKRKVTPAERAQDLYYMNKSDMVVYGIHNCLFEDIENNCVKVTVLLEEEVDKATAISGLRILYGENIKFEILKTRELNAIFSS